MKLTLANIKEIKRKSESPLKRRVCNYVIDRWSEYSDKSGMHKVLQCYASYNQKPSEEILHYVNKVWLPYANKHLKQIQTAA